MRFYKREGRVLYLAEGKEAKVHFVPLINWREYLCLRLNIPKICKIFDTVEEAKDAATD